MLEPHQFEFIFQFVHPEKTLVGAPGFVGSDEDHRLVAPLLGVDLQKYREMRKLFSDRARGAAQELLGDQAFAKRVDKLPFLRGDVVVGLGDSITDDYQSWLEILRHLVAIRRPSDGITFINAGISGDTTSQMMTRFLAVVNAKPNWIICFAGTNDARMHGQSPAKTLVSLAETELNLKAMRSYGAKQAPQARWAWITPATVIQQKVASHWFLGPMQLSWRNSDLAAIANVQKRFNEPVVDLQTLFGDPPDPKLLIDDGLHPSLAGQKAIVRALVESISG